MSRKKAPFRNYEGTKPNDKHIRLTESMMMSNAYLKLSNSAKTLYAYMKLWSCGNDEFEYPLSLSSKYMAKRTFLNAKKELIANRFYRGGKRR